MKKTKKTNRKIDYLRILDCLYLIAFPILSIIFILTIRQLTDKYAIIASFVLLLIFLIAVLSLRYQNKIIPVFRRISMIVLCGLLAYGSIFANENINSLVNIVDPVAEDIEVSFDVLVKKDADFFGETITSIDDLKNHVISYQQAEDKEFAKKIEKDLDKSVGPYQRLFYDDYQTMYDDFYNGSSNAIVVNQTQKELLPEIYASLYEDSTILKTYTYKVKSDINGNDIDITNTPFTVLISGTDDIGSPTSRSKSDMNMLLMVDPKTRHITTISIPRDAYIPNPAYNDVNDKLTHTGNNGINNTVSAISNAFDIEVDFYVKISFTSLIEIVDVLGGIEVDVAISFEEQDENRSFEDGDLIRLEAGTQTLNGRQTLAYARHRHSYVNQDLGRNEAQLAIIKGIVRKIASPSGITKANDVLNVVPKYVLMNFSKIQLTSFVKDQVDDLSAWKIDSIPLINGVDDSNYTASGGYETSSVHYLSKRDVYKVNAIYQLYKKAKPLSEFKFDLNDIYKYEVNYDETKDIELAP